MQNQNIIIFEVVTIDMSIKNTLKRDFIWFKTYGLIKRIIVSVIMAILTMLIVAGLDFRDEEVASIGLLAFIIFFIVIYLLLAWVFGDEQPIRINEKVRIKGEVEKLESPEVSKQKEVKNYVAKPANDDINAVYTIIGVLFLLSLGIVFLNYFNEGNKNDNRRISEPTPTSNDYEYFNEINQRQYPSNSSINEKKDDNKFHSLDEFDKPLTDEELLNNPYKVTPRNQIENK